MEKGQPNYRIPVESMPGGMLTLSREGLILDCNSQFSDMAGVDSEKIRGLAPGLNWQNRETPGLCRVKLWTTHQPGGTLKRNQRTGPLL